jgi:hypothetical protein
VARPLPLDIEIGRVSPIDVMKNLRQIPSGSPQKKMVMVVHKAVDMNDAPIPLMGRLQIGKKLLSISIIPENSLPLVPSRGHVIKSPSILNAQWTSHQNLSS